MIIRQWYCQPERNDLPSARVKARELDCTNSERSGVDRALANPSMPVASWASHQRIPGYRMWRPYADHSSKRLDEAHGPCFKLRYRIPVDTHEQDFVKCCLRRFFEDKTLLQDESEGARDVRNPLAWQSRSHVQVRLVYARFKHAPDAHPAATATGRR